MKYGSSRIISTLGLFIASLSGAALAQQSYFPGWSSYAGEDYDSDLVQAVAADGQTNTYFGGSLGGGGAVLSNSDGVSVTENEFLLTTGGLDGFVAKADSAGQLLWYTVISGGEDDRVNAVAVHPDGTVYAAGLLNRTGDSSDEGTDATLTALSGLSGVDAWTLPVGNFNGTNGFTAVAVDSSGYIYAAGYTTVTNLQNTVSGTSYKGQTDACVIKVSPAGSVVWSRYLGGAHADAAAALALAADGSVYVGGQTRSPGWTSIPTASTGPATPDGFVAKLTSSGAQVWSLCIGGSASNAVTALAKAPSAPALYLGGATTSSAFLPGTTNLNSHAGASDGFVVALTDLGAAVQTNWCRFFGGGGADRVTALGLSTNGFLAVGGTAASGGWLTQAGTSAFSGAQDGFLSLLDGGGAVSWSSYVGGTNRDDVSALAVRADKLVAAGGTHSPLWISGGFWPSWSKDTNFDEVPDYDAPFGFVATWTAEPGAPPTVTDQPDDLTVNEGASAAFSVAAAGTAPLTYRWFRNGVPVTGLTSNTYVVASAAPTNNTDTYCCVVSNFYGVAVSSNATLTVIANGTLTVTLSPAQAVSQGARWSLTGGASWLASGASTNLPPAAYTVTFTNLAGWLSPAPLSGVQVFSGTATATSGLYTAVLPSAERAITGTNVTLTVRAPAGLSTWVLVETLPAGLTPAAITAGGVWDSGARTLTFTGAEATTNAYSYTALCATSGLYTVSGTVTPLPAGVPVAVAGGAQILKANIVRAISGTAVSLSVYQPSPSFVWSVYETLPAGLSPTNIIGSLSSWNPETRTITWFNVGVVQTLGYGVTGGPGTYAPFSGYGNVSGANEPVFGDSAMTIPGAAVPAPDILSLIPAGAGTGTLAFTSVVNQAYAILTNATLGATNGWSVCLPVTGDAGVTAREVPMASPQLFFRVRVAP